MTVIARGEVTRLASPGDHVMITGVSLEIATLILFDSLSSLPSVGLSTNDEDRF